MLAFFPNHLATHTHTYRRGDILLLEQLCVSDLSTTEHALCNELLSVVLLQKYSYL